MKRFGVFVATIAAVAAIFTAGVAVAGGDGATSPNEVPGGPANAPRSTRATTPTKPASVYHAVTPCRLADTRQAGGPITDGARTFLASGNLTSQGGGAACGIPTTATAVAMNITTITANGQSGFLRGWAKGGTPPNATLVNYDKAGISNMVNVPVSSLGFVLRNYGSANVVVDALGYYEPEISAVMAYNGGVLSGGAMVVSNTKTGTGSYRVVIARDLTGCTPIASIHGGAYIASAYISGQFVYANTYTTTGTLTDLYWTLTVVC